MFIRALTAFLVLPGLLAFVVPLAWLWFSGNRYDIRPTGVVVLVLGACGLLWCVRDFYVAGKGTLAPWAPPKLLVTIGLYRYSRNPMYVSVIFILCGWAAAFSSPVLFIYTLACAIAFHLRVVFGEEPWLARSYGSEWEQYASHVPRWFGVVRSPKT